MNSAHLFAAFGRQLPDPINSRCRPFATFTIGSFAETHFNAIASPSPRMTDSGI